MKSAKTIAAAIFAATLPTLADISEISVNMAFDSIEYVAGERIRAVVDVKNASPGKISVGYSNSEDSLIVEVFRSSDMHQLERNDRGSPFVAEFMVKPNEGQKLETFVGDHYAVREPRRYLARPVLVHGGMRYEGQLRAFDIVPGLKVASALQMFSNREGLRREFSLLSWNRKSVEHLFLAATDSGTSSREWVTTDLGTSLRIAQPTITILPSGEVIVLHRCDRDYFLRTEFWSLPEALEYQSRELLQDPEIAGAERVRELYRDSGGVKAKHNPWWKFW